MLSIDFVSSRTRLRITLFAFIKSITNTPLSLSIFSIAFRTFKFSVLDSKYPKLVNKLKIASNSLSQNDSRISLTANRRLSLLNLFAQEILFGDRSTPIVLNPFSFKNMECLPFPQAKSRIFDSKFS